MSEYPRILNPAEVRRRLARLERTVFGPGLPGLTPLQSELKEPPQSDQDGPPFCNECGNPTVRNGGSYRCHNCGNTMGRAPAKMASFSLPPLDVIQGKRKAELCSVCNRPEWECGDPLCDKEPPEPPPARAPILCTDCSYRSGRPYHHLPPHCAGAKLPPEAMNPEQAIGPPGSPFPAAEECPHCGGRDLASPTSLMNRPGGWVVCLDCSGGKVKYPDPKAMSAEDIPINTNAMAWSSLPFFPKTDPRAVAGWARVEAERADAKILDICRNGIEGASRNAPTLTPAELVSALDDVLGAAYYLAEQEGRRGNSAGFEAFGRTWLGLLMLRNYLQADTQPGKPSLLDEADAGSLVELRDWINETGMDGPLTGMFG